MITIKLTYNNFEEIKDDLNPYIHQYNCVFRYCYNRVQENKDIKQKELDLIIKNLNNIELLDFSLRRNAVMEALSMKYKEKVIFGGKKNFFKRKFGKITKEEFLENRNVPLYLIGSKADTNGNRKAKLDIIDNNSIKLKLSRDKHLNIQLPHLNNKLKGNLIKLQTCCENNESGFTLKIDNKHVYIIFDEEILRTNKHYNFIENRILSIDLNPNYIAYTIIDWKNNEENNVLCKEIIDLKELNSLKKKNNKVKFELNNVCKYIIETCKHYKCEMVAIEDLNIESKDNKKGKKFNKTVNNDWKRNLVVNNLTKRCCIEKIGLNKVFAAYSSFVGQIVNYNDYDSIAAAIEISRRAYILKLNCGYAKFDIKSQINYPKLNIDGFSATRWKDMQLNTLSQYGTWKSLYDYIKKSKISYRFLFTKEGFDGVSFRLKSWKSVVQRHKCH